MEKRILAVLIAMLAGGAYAQRNYQTSSEGPKSTATQPAGAPWEVVRRASARVAPIAKAPEPAPAPLAAAAPAPVVIEKISLSTGVLFPFNSAELLPGGKQKLDELAQNAQGANVQQVALTGHADRIGSEEYNQQLSEERAQAVADYLAQKGVSSDKLQGEGKGKSEPITGNECSNLGAENNKNQKLIACLQPDRRVDAALLGSRESTASTGASTSSSAGSSSGGISAGPSASGPSP